METMSDKSEKLRETQLSDEKKKKKDFLEEESSVGVTAEGQETERSGEDQAELLRDQLLRTMADFENFKKRKQKEFSDLVQHANERLIVDMLPVLDDFERALKASRDLRVEDAAIQQALQGFDFIHKKLMKTLEAKGLKPMNSVGTAFDPELHDALMQVDDPEKESQTIVDEHEKGYFLNDKVIRHAKVIVSK